MSSDNLDKALSATGLDKEGILAGALGMHIMVEVGALLNAKRNIEEFAAFHLEHPKGPPLNVLWDAVIDFTMHAVVGGTAAHYRLLAQRLGFDLDREDDKLNAIMRRVREADAGTAAAFLTAGGITVSEARKFLNDEGPFSTYLRQGA